MAAQLKKPAKSKRPEPIPVFASQARIKEVKNDIKELEQMLEEDKHRKVPKITDPSEVKAEILKKQQYVLRHSPPTLRGENANRAFKKAKELERTIKENMIRSSLFSQHYPKGSDSHSKQQKFEEAVRQQMHFMTDPNLKRATLEYKNIMARLSGGDPHESNIERLRRAR